MNEKELPPVDLAVIGAGMAGLSAAVHARLAGLSVRVFEQHFLPGGLCTAWKRKGYVFDYCIDYFWGTDKAQGFHEIWRQLGVIGRSEFRHIDSFGSYRGRDGHVLNLYTDHRRLQAHLLDLSPQDARMIKQLCAAIRKARRFVMSEFVPSVAGLARLLRSLPALPTIQKWSGVSVAEWCGRLQSSFLREAIPPLIGMVDFPMSGPIMAFGLMQRDCIGYPLGGSLPIARAVEERALGLGAEIIYRAGVKRVLVENGQAVGIELEDGRIQKARQVVAACDVRAVLDRLLDGQVRSDAYEALFAKRQIQPSLVQVSLGVRMDPAWGLADLPKRINVPAATPVVIDGRERPRLGIYQYSQDPAMAPAGDTVLVVQFEGDYDGWKRLAADPTAYRAEKARILAETIRALEGQFPGISDKVRASDVATPTTCERYTGNWRGSSQGWIVTKDLMKMLVSGKHLPRRFPEIRALHLIGQWTEPGGGLPPAARNGRDVVRTIMKEMGERRIARR